MKMFVVDMDKDKFTIEKGLGLTYRISGKKSGFKKFWMGSIICDDVNECVFLSKDVQERLPEIPQKLGEFEEIKKKAEEIRIDDVKFIEHPTIDYRWMAVHNESKRAIVFFSKFKFDVVFPITESNVFVEKDCPHNHRLSNSLYKDKCPLCGAKGFSLHNYKTFSLLAEKYGIEIGQSSEVYDVWYKFNFLHVEDGKINVLTTNCNSHYELRKTAETKYNSYPSFELTPGEKILIGATVNKDLYILSVSFDGTEIKVNVEKKIERVVFDFNYDIEVDKAEYVLKKLIESRKSSELVYESDREVEDSPFAVLKNMKFD